MEIGRISMMVEIDGQPCSVFLSQEKLRILIDMAASLCNTGILPVRKLPKEYSFETIEK